MAAAGYIALALLAASVRLTVGAENRVLGYLLVVLTSLSLLALALGGGELLKRRYRLARGPFVFSLAFWLGTTSFMLAALLATTPGAHDAAAVVLGVWALAATTTLASGIWLLGRMLIAETGELASRDPNLHGLELAGPPTPVRGRAPRFRG